MHYIVNVSRLSVGSRDIGVEAAFEQAQQSGLLAKDASLKDYHAMKTQAESSKGFVNAQTAQDYANKLYGGNMTNMLKDDAIMTVGKMAEGLGAIKEQGSSPAHLAKMTGQMNTLSALARGGAFELLGDKEFMNTEKGKLLNEAAKFHMLGQAAEKAGDFNKDGKIDDRDTYDFLQAHHGTGIKYATEDGVKTMSMTQDGKTLFSEMQGTLNTPQQVAKMQGDMIAAGKGEAAGYCPFL